MDDLSVVSVVLWDSVDSIYIPKVVGWPTQNYRSSSVQDIEQHEIRPIRETSLVISIFKRRKKYQDRTGDTQRKR